MSVAGISSTNFANSGVQNMHRMMQEFKQLGQDLQSGNLSAAQSDFVTLQSALPQSNVSSSSQSSNSIGSEFNQLSKDLQSGNLSGAQQDYSTLKQSLQSQASQQTQSTQGSGAVEGHRHHHHGGGGGGSDEITQLMDQLGQSLQSGDLTGAQQTFTTLQTEFQQLTAGNGNQSQSASAVGSNSISVNA